MVKKRKYDESSEEEKYHVEVITAARVNEDRDWEYRVKWAGYDSDADTWEPSANVAECDRLLKSFWKHVGQDDEDYDIGTEFKATPTWIAREKKFFHDNFGKEDKKPEKKKKKKVPEVQPKKVVGKTVKKSKNVKKPTYVWTESSSSESEEDEPMSKAKTVSSVTANVASSSKSNMASSSRANAPSTSKTSVPSTSKTSVPSTSKASVPSTSKASTSLTSKANAASTSKAKQPSKRLPSVESSDSDTPIRKAPRKESIALASKADKGKAPVRPRPATPPSSDDLHSLFSAPPTPQVPSRTRSLPNPQAQNQPTASTSTTTMPPPKVPAQTHKERQANPRIKMVDLPTAANVSQAIATKRKIAAQRSGSGQQPASTSAADLPLPYDSRKHPLKALHFKKKKPTEDTAGAQDAAKTSGSTANTQASGDGSRPLFLPDADQVDSPISSRSGTWGRTSNSPAPVADAGGWGTGGGNQTSTNDGVGGWGSASATATGWGDETAAAPTTSGWGDTSASNTGWGDAAAPTGSGWGDTGGSASGWGGNDDSTSPQDNGPTASSSRGAAGGWGVASNTTMATGPTDATSKPAAEGHAPSADKASAPSRRPSGVPIPRTNVTSRKPSDSMQAAENFLADIMPDALAAPMEEPSMDVDEPASRPVVPAVKKTVPSPQVATGDKWQWTGQLSIATGPQNTEQLCNICLCEPTTPRPGGLRLNICYTPDVTALRLEKFYNAADIYILLRACAPVQQYCKVSRQGEEDESAFSTLTKYMARKQNFTFAHVDLDEDPVGILVVFFSGSAELCAALKLPLRFHNAGTLYAAFLPWNLSYQQYQEYRWQQPRSEDAGVNGTLDPRLEEKLKSGTRRFAKNPELMRGLRLHRFKLPEYDFLARSPRTYCIWTPSENAKIEDPDFETQSLIAVLDACKARNVGFKADVRVVFVHVAALKTFHKLEALGMRRSKQFDMRIYSYGSHSSVPPERWGLREIYPIGGILTFTPKAVMEDPFEVYRLIGCVKDHPLWTCYIHPFAVAVIARLSYPNDDVLSLIDKNEFFFIRLLELIEHGDISLLYAPPADSIPKLEPGRTDRMVDPTAEWAGWCCSLLSMGPKELMQECQRLFMKKHGKAPDSHLVNLLDRDILTDMVQMQRQPALMDNYRRFVIITETRNAITPDSRGVELLTLGKFDFKDEYPMPR